MSERKKYTTEFKLDAISLVKEQGYTCTEAARSPVDLMCRLFGVTRSGFYSYQKRKQTELDNNQSKKELLYWVLRIAESSHFTYGTRRLKNALNALGYPIGRRKTRSLMREANILVRYKKKYRVTTDSNPKKPVFENILNRQFQVDEPDRVYVSDNLHLDT